MASLPNIFANNKSGQVCRIFGQISIIEDPSPQINKQGTGQLFYGTTQ